MYADNENHIKTVLYAFPFSKTNQEKKIIHQNIPSKPQEVIGTDVYIK